MSSSELTPALDQLSVKRKRPRRASRPCDSCRKRKTRCVLNSRADNCVHCDLRDAKCSFEAEPPRRIPRNAASIGTSGTVHPRPELNITLDSIVTRADTQSEHHREEEEYICISPQDVSTVGAPSEMTVLPTVFGANAIAKQGELRLLGFAAGRFAELYGLGSDMEPVLMRHRPYDPTTQEYRLTTHSIRRVLENDAGRRYPLTFHMADNSKATGYSAGFTRVDAIEQCVQPHGLRLVNLFFRNVHPAYPVVCREAFTRAYLKTYRNIAPPLLGAVYLAALQRWAYDTDLAVHDPPDARILRQLTLDAIQRCYHAPHLWSIQAVLLLLQCQSEDPLNPDHTFAAGLTAQAIAVGHCLGLHLDASSWTIPLWEKNVRKRLSWALLMQDRWTALAYGRPLHIHEDDWGVRDLELTDFTDRVTTDEGMQHDQSNNAANAAHDAGATTTTDVNALETTGSVLFMKMAELTQILTRILSSFYSLKGSLEQDTLALYKTAEPILLSLREFEAELPPSLNLGARYQRQLSFHGNLWALYYGVRIALLRRIVRSIALPPECSDDLVLSTVRQEALSVVREATSFVYELRPDQLQGFWYFAVPYIFSLMGSFTTVLLVTSLSTQERSFWQDTLNTYLWHLKFSSSSSDAMKYAVNRLESAVLRGMEHALAVNDREPLGGTITPPTVLPRTELDFADFGVWDLATEDLGIFDFLNMDSIT